MKKKILLLILIYTIATILFLINKNLSYKKTETKQQTFSPDFIDKSKQYWLNDDLSQYNTKIEIPNSDHYIIGVWKKDHKLKLIKNQQVIKEYNVNIKNDLPDRFLAADKQTPEGIFEISQMAVVTDPAWERWIAFDTTEKAKQIFGKEFKNGETILNNYEQNYNKIENDADIRDFNSRNPKTQMLRGFGIHGGGYSPNYDWTHGCPGMDDEDVIELYALLQTNPQNGIGTKVIIQD